MKKDERIYMKALELYGEGQIDICVEEMSELIKELCKFKRYRENLSSIAEEIADVKITIAQMEMLFGCKEEVKEWVDRKLKRLEGRLWGQ